MLVFQPIDEDTPANPSNSFHIGMAIGWFFGFLILLLISFSIHLLNRLKTTVLKPLPAPLLASALSCLLLLLLSLKLAN